MSSFSCPSVNVRKKCKRNLKAGLTLNESKNVISDKIQLELTPKNEAFQKRKYHILIFIFSGIFEKT